MKALLFERSLARYAAARVAGALMPGAGARVGPLSLVDMIGLDVLLEAHDADELHRAVSLEADVVGVNARDLSTFEIDRGAQLELVARISRHETVVVAESGIQTRAQGAAAELAGADAILVGSSLMRADDPPAKLTELLPDDR